VQIQQGLAAGISGEEAAAELRKVVAGIIPAGTEPPAGQKVPVYSVVSAQADAAPEDAPAPADGEAVAAQEPRQTAAAAG
jgi:hypothetical protein